jgi:hypothetical protein
MVETDGSVINGEVTEPGQPKWFVFNAVAGETYQIDVDLGTLSDSVLELMEGDQTTIIVENDDDPRVHDVYASYIEWTCPDTGLYYASVHEYGMELGTFTISITSATSGGGMFGEGGAAGGDPCHGVGRWGAHLVGQENAVRHTISPLLFG